MSPIASPYGDVGAGRIRVYRDRTVRLDHLDRRKRFVFSGGDIQPGLPYLVPRLADLDAVFSLQYFEGERGGAALFAVHCNVSLRWYGPERHVRPRGFEGDVQCLLLAHAVYGNIGVVGQIPLGFDLDVMQSGIDAIDGQGRCSRGFLVDEDAGIVGGLGSDLQNAGQLLHGQGEFLVRGGSHFDLFFKVVITFPGRLDGVGAGQHQKTFPQTP